MQLGLRTKVIVLSSFLLLLPWLGYQYVAEMETFLRYSQEKNLVATTRALASALHERPALFDTQASFLKNVEKGRDLYAYNIADAIQLDGKLHDWQPYQPLFWQYDKRYLSKENQHHKSSDLSFNHMVGKYKQYLYAVFQVNDDDLVFRAKNSLSITNNDYLKIAFTNPQGELQTYIVAAKQPGWINAFESDTKKPVSAIQGYFLQTETGYNIELRLPLSFLANKLGFAIIDIDNGQLGEKEMATSNLSQPNELGSVLVPSPEIEKIVKGMARSGSRIWVVDNHQRVLAESGTIQQAAGNWGEIVNERKNNSWWETIEQEYLHPLYYAILTKPSSDFIDHSHDVASLNGSHIEGALQGRSESSWRITPDQKAVILSAAYPIWIDDKVMGAVIAEESTNGIRQIRNKAFEKLFNVILAVMLIGTLALFFFASHISSRIRKLRDAAEGLIDEQGRVKGNLDGKFASDEIGDLSRSFANMVGRLGGYTDYLEKMSSRLSHELRTPVAVVRSSLESLELQNLDEKSQKYVSRASEGVNRLNNIITNMSEATRIEHAIEHSAKERYNMSEVVVGCMQGYQLAYPNWQFSLNLCNTALIVHGVPELLAQLLDKVISNAMEFATPDSAIEVNLTASQQHAKLSIYNQGAALPEKLSQHIFDSMVSVRTQAQQNEPHLGLGLYIARLITEFHNGQIKAENFQQGVIIELVIPLLSEKA